MRERLGWTDAIAQAEKADALTLIRRLGGHALALVITAQRMAKSTPHIMTCASALRDLQAAPSLVKALKLPERNDPEGNVAVSFALSYAQLNQEQKSTFLALGLCASSGAPAQAIARMTEVDDPAAVERLEELAGRSLADYDGNRRRASLHPLLHSYARALVDDPTISEQRRVILSSHIEYFGQEIGGAYQRTYQDEQGDLAGQVLQIARPRTRQHRAGSSANVTA